VVLRVLRTVVLLAVAVVALWFAGKAIFHVGGEAPGTGEGDPVKVVTTP
jgi:hypothetical protein